LREQDRCVEQQRWRRITKRLASEVSTAEAAATLKKMDRVYVEGILRLDTWQASDGTERVESQVRKEEANDQSGR